MRIPEQTARLLRALTDSRALSGAALGVVGGAGERATLVLGHAQLVPETRVLTPAHWFDLASLTKPLLTAREVLRATGRGQLDLDDPLSVHLPETGGRALGGRTLRQLLSHSSGVPAGGFLPLHEWGDPATIRARLPLEPWELGEVGAVEYSDLGYLLLGLVLERVTGRPLGDFELDAGLTFFPDPAQAVATEACPWRGRVMRGEVHDEKAFALGGPAGHAGLFGTLDGVLSQAERLLRGGWLGAAAQAAALRPETGGQTLAFVQAQPGWSGGSLCSPSAYGHTGFTGTGLWVDPERGLAWTLLTNRVHPRRQTSIDVQALRRAVGNTLLAHLG
ncbi:serine hydrolase domain-containing protein [Deinococcus wulumuqiensis]|uniref:serine hydrolase domain-containing protein n=1 Tax=Deinococcus wulumuqiensis TaxID=980427 RepID=UPI00242D49F4|nr:serine hydrolase domain-containing protein [Deinococcus wulumuqiensis]